MKENENGISASHAALASPRVAAKTTGKTGKTMPRKTTTKKQLQQQRRRRRRATTATSSAPRPYVILVSSPLTIFLLCPAFLVPHLSFSLPSVGHPAKPQNYNLVLGRSSTVHGFFFCCCFYKICRVGSCCSFEHSNFCWM